MQYHTMRPTYTCRLLSPEQLQSNSSWELRPSLPDSYLTHQSSESIRRIGLLYQPIVQQSSDGSFEFITGRRCFTTFQTIYPETAIWCRVVADNTPAKEILGLVFEENSRSHPLSVIERAHFFQLCDQLLDSNQKAELFKQLELQVNPHIINRTLELLQLEPPVQTALITENIPEIVARELLKLNNADQKAVFALFMQLNIGGGKQRRMLALLRDLVGRQGVSVVEYLRKNEIQNILNHPEMNVPQKAQSLLQFLQNLLSPSLLEAETHFTAWKSALKLPENCDITHSQAFEQDTVVLSVTFKNKEDMEKRLKDMKQFLSAEPE